MRNSEKTIKNIIMFCLPVFLLLISPIFASARTEQKAVDVLYKIIKNHPEKISSVYNETAKTSDGTEFPCHIYEVAQYKQNFSSFGPPVALSTSITLSSGDQEYSGVYITIYVINSSKKTAEFMKIMSEDWIPNSRFHGMPSLEIKTTEQVTNFFFICGRYIFREERFNTASMREEIYSAATAANLQSDTDYTEESADTSGQQTVSEPEQNQEPATATEPPADTGTSDEAAGSVQAEEETQPVSREIASSEVNTPYESWMNNWKIRATSYKTKYVIDKVNDAIAPPGGGYKMIVLKPKNSSNPAVIEGRFKPKSYQSSLYLRAAGIRNPDASAVISIEVNGYPVLRDQVVRGSEGWKEFNINIGALNPSFSVVLIKILPDPFGRKRLDALFIDEIAVDGDPMFNNKFNITQENIAAETGEAPLLELQGLWTDLRNFRYTIRQKGNTFTFSCTEKMDEYLWEISGEGKIEDDLKIFISFSEKYAPLGKIVKSEALGTYDKSRKMIIWSGKNKRFPGEWIFIK